MQSSRRVEVITRYQHTILSIGSVCFARNLNQYLGWMACRRVLLPITLFYVFWFACTKHDYRNHQPFKPSLLLQPTSKIDFSITKPTNHNFKHINTPSCNGEKPILVITDVPSEKNRKDRSMKTTIVHTRIKVIQIYVTGVYIRYNRIIIFKNG